VMHGAYNVKVSFSSSDFRSNVMQHIFICVFYLNPYVILSNQSMLVCV
jgi:hypothetical protein